MENVFVSSHPLVLTALSFLRDKTTPRSAFRHYARIIAMLLITEASYDLLLKEKKLTTPLQPTFGMVAEEHVVLMTIFRAGLSMLEPALDLFPHAPVGFAGLVRDEKTAVASEYYWKVPRLTKESVVFLLDPMLATGGSLLHVLKKIQTPVKQIRLVTIISAPEGITSIHDQFPGVLIFTGAVDEKLNNQKFIVPGLGDFGDRYFGTEE
ncbi:MAG: uracil phosphoribosyltransferase [Candidatus Levybacteria bacterium]|nr:uracil phosphoribosyltransferase [Candidatus Levybacteria bacterium]